MQEGIEADNEAEDTVSKEECDNLEDDAEQRKARKAAQVGILKHLAQKVWQGAREFDLDDSTANTDSAFDHLVSENAI
jgi:hypothetical protein